MKKISIEERVDLLLKEGVNNPKKWMPVQSYKEPGPEHLIPVGDFWGAEWQRLHNHHLEETMALFNIIGELVKRLEK